MLTSAAHAYPFLNPELAPEDRVDDLISRLTLEEKISCLSTDPSVPRLGLQGSRHVEGLHGLALGGPGKWGDDEPIATTTFPQAIGLAETWDPELVERVAEAEAREARFVFHTTGAKRGGIVVRAPNADLGRDPRWGRTEECYGEDAFFNGVMTMAFVRGLQGKDPRYWQAAALMKHFLANSNEDGREKTSSDFDARLFREYYSVPFRKGVEQGSRAYMAAYNAYNGIPCATHPMLREVTVEEWGQDGIICTDGGAYKMLVNEHHQFADFPEAAAACIQAGITQFLDDYRPGLEQALAKGLVTEAELDRVLRGTFRVMLKLGLLDPKERVPYAQIDASRDPVASEEHRQLARLVTRKSIVLLKNEGKLLPLDGAALTSVAVIGALADDVLLDWYSGTPPYRVSPLAGIRQRLGPEVEVTYAAPDNEEEAVRIARTAEFAIVCVGNHPTGDGPWAKVTLPSYGKEAVDRRSLTLEAEELVKKVWLANPRTIVVLISSFPYAIRWTQDHVPAIVHVTHNSQELGNGLADVLFGDENPAGRLVQTWPQSIEDLPPMLDYDIRHGRTYMYFQGKPLYPFGFGLSYTSFAYLGLEASATKLEADGELTFWVSLQNTGEYEGEEVVQLYVSFPGSKVERPLRKLAAFRRVSLAPGETKRVELTLCASELAYWDTALGRFVVEAAPVRVAVGRSAAEIELETSVTVEHEH